MPLEMRASKCLTAVAFTVGDSNLMGTAPKSALFALNYLQCACLMIQGWLPPGIGSYKRLGRMLARLSTKPVRLLNVNSNIRHPLKTFSAVIRYGTIDPGAM